MIEDMGIAAPLLYAVWLAANTDPAPDPKVLIEGAIEAGQQNKARSANWLGREEIKGYNLRKKRKLIYWLTYETSRLEGQAYYRLTARDGKSLSKKDAAKEQKRLEETARQRRMWGKAKSGNDAAVKRSSISLPQVLTSHDLVYKGEDTVNGRRIWMVEASLRHDAPRPARFDDLALCGNLSLWIDQETKLVSMQDLRVTRLWRLYVPGSMVRLEMDWNGQVMLASRITVHLSGLGVMNEQTYTEYRHFGVESSIQFDATAESDSQTLPQ